MMSICILRLLVAWPRLDQSIESHDRIVRMFFLKVLTATNLLVFQHDVRYVDCFETSLIPRGERRFVISAEGAKIPLFLLLVETRLTFHGPLFNVASWKASNSSVIEELVLPSSCDDKPAVERVHSLSLLSLIGVAMSRSCDPWAGPKGPWGSSTSVCRDLVRVLPRLRPELPRFFLMSALFSCRLAFASFNSIVSFLILSRSWNAPCIIVTDMNV